MGYAGIGGALWGTTRGPYSTPPWGGIWTHFCLENCILHVVFLRDSAANKVLKDFSIFLDGNEWHHHLEEEQLGRCVILIDQVAAKKKRKKIRKLRILHKFIRFTKMTYQTDVSNLVPRVSHLSAPGVQMRDPGNEVGMSLVPIAQITKKQFATRVFKIFRSGQRKIQHKKLRKFLHGAGYTIKREEAVHLFARIPILYVLRWSLIEHDPNLNTIRVTSSVANNPRYLWKVFRWKKLP